MKNKKFISWRRVSTLKQGKSGLGLTAQKDLINYFVKAENGILVADYEEVYTGTELRGCLELQKAIKHCKEIGAILIIAKTDRFRNTIEALQVYDEMGDGNIYFCDLPHTDKFTLTLFFALAEREALMVSIRTKSALAVRKKQLAEDGYFITKEGKRCEKLGGGTMEQAVKRASELRQEKARQNQANLFLIKYIDNFEKRNGELNGKTDRKVWEDLAEELNNLGQTTSKGLPFNYVRLYAMVKRVKKY